MSPSDRTAGCDLSRAAVVGIVFAAALVLSVDGAEAPPPPSLPQVLEQLKSQDRDTLYKALAGINRLGPGVAKDVLPSLVRLTGSEDPKVRWAAVDTLGMLGGAARDAAPAIIKALDDENPQPRERAATAMVQVGVPYEQAKPLLLKCLAAKDAGVASGAVMALGMYGAQAKEMAGELVKLSGTAESRTGRVRDTIRDSLCRFGTDVVPVLEAAYDGADRQTRSMLVRVLIHYRQFDSPSLAKALRIREADGAAGNSLGRAVVSEAAKHGAAAIPLLLKALDPEVRREVRSEAVRALTALGQPAVPALKQALKDPDENIRSKAAAALQTMASPDASAPTDAEVASIKDPEVAKLVEQLKHKSQDTRRSAAFHLARMGAAASEAAPALGNALSDENALVAETAAQALAAMGGEAKKALPALVSAFKTSRGKTRTYVTEALASTAHGSPEVMDEFVKALGEPKSGSRAAIATALGIFAEKALPYLEKLLREDTDAGVRVGAVRGLGKVGAKAVPALIRALGDQSDEVRFEAVKALAPLAKADTEALAGLQQAVRDKSEVVKRAALEGITAAADAAPPAERPEKVLAALAEAMRAESYHLRADAVRRMASLGPDAIPILETALDDRNSLVRSEAVQALGKIGPKARMALERALNSSNPEVQTAAVHALARLGRESVPALSGALSSRKNLQGDILRACAVIGPAAFPMLISTIEGSDRDLRRQAMVVLVRLELNPKEHLQPLLTKVATCAELDDRVSLAGIAMRLASEAEPREALLSIRFCLAHRDSAVVIQAMRAAASLGPAAKEFVPGLIQLLKSPPADVRIAAAGALGAIGAEAKEAVPGLTEALVFRDHYGVPRAAAQALGRLGPAAAPAVPALLKLLDPQTDMETRVEAAWALGEIGPAANGAAAALRNLLADRVPQVRCAAAKSLWQLTGNKDAVVAEIRKCLKADSTPVLRTAARTLTAMGPAAKELVPDVEQVLKQHELDLTCKLAWFVWTVSGDADKVVPTLSACLQEKSWSGSRLEIIEMLARIGPKAKAAEAALRGVTDPETGGTSLRKAADRALEKILGGENKPPAQ